MGPEHMAPGLQGLRQLLEGVVGGDGGEEGLAALLQAHPELTEGNRVAGTNQEAIEALPTTMVDE